MSLTLVFREIAKPTDHDLDIVRTMLYGELWNQYDKLFSVTAAEVSQYRAEYEDIIPYCAKLSTQDGVEIYVAKCKLHIYKYDRAIYQYLKKYSSEAKQKYSDITERCGEVVRWISGDSQTEKCEEWQIPNVVDGARLFYRVTD